MQEHMSDLRAIASRLEQLEKQNKRLKQLGYLAALAGMTFLVMGQAQPVHIMEAEQFVVRDASGKVRAQLSLDASGTPALDFFNAGGKREAEYRSGDVMLFGDGEMMRLTAQDISISSRKGDIELQSNPLRLHISDPADGYGSISLGIVSSLKNRDELDAALTLSGPKGRGFTELATGDGPYLHMEPGMWQGKVLAGGFVDIASKNPLMQISDQRGFSAGIGNLELKDKETGKLVSTSAASIVLTGKDRVIWSTP